MGNRPTMEETYMKFAKLVAERSTCRERHVGSVITSADYERVYSIGYNGNAAGRINSCEGDGSSGGCKCIHSEINALIKCGVTDKNKVMFVTLAPCVMCAKTMVNSGFSKVFYLEDWKNNPGLTILRDASIVVTKLEVWRWNL
jgi:dCMP deaminase